MFKHTIIQQEMLKITVSIKQRQCFLIVPLEFRNCGPTFWNSLDKTLKHCKTTKHFRNQLNQLYYLNTTDFILEHVLCVLCTLSICKVCYFASLLKLLLRA